MKTKTLFLVVTALCGMFITSTPAFAQGSAFNYQGRLNDAGQPANGIYDLRFNVYDAVTNGNVFGNPLTNAATTVTAGLFSVTLDFGAGVFTGPNLWLEVGVRTNGGGTFTTLSPRQPILPMPYAIMANTASNLLGTLPAAQLSGTIPLAQLPSAVVTNHQSGVVFNGVTTVSNLSVMTGEPTAIAPLTVPPNVPVAAIGSVATESSPTSLAVAGRYVYVVNWGSNSLQVFDVSSPSNPANVGSVVTGNKPRSVAVAGRYAYVVNDGSRTLQIFDVSNPSGPVSTGSATTTATPYFVAVVGRYAYVVGSSDISDSRLQVFDVSNPSAPVVVGSVGTDAYPTFVTVAGRYAYVVNYAGNGLQIFDVSNPSSPVSVGSVGMNYTVSAAVAGRYAYVGNVGGGPSGELRIFDVSNPSAPVSVGLMAGVPGSIEVGGQYLYTVTGSTLQIIDVSNPSSPVSVGSVNTGNSMTRIAVAGRYAYVLSLEGTLQIFDLGGAFVSQLEAGAIETGKLQTRDTVTVGNSLNVLGGMTVSASARISGGLSVDSGNISGNGTGLTNLPAGNLTGTMADAQLSANVALLNGSPDFAGAVTAPSFSGNGSGLTNLNADLLDGLDSAAFAPATGSSVYVAKAGDTMSGPLYLPNNGLAVGSNQFVLANGNVGVGTTSPTSRLQVAGGDLGLGNATVAGNQPITIWLTNASGAIRSAGEIVIIGSSDNSFTVTSTGSSTAVIGVVYDTSIPSGAIGRIAVGGVVSVQSAGATVRGQHVRTSATLGKATSDGSPTSGSSIGIWLETGGAAGTWRALLR